MLFPLSLTGTAASDTTSTPTLLSGVGQPVDSKSFLQELNSGNTTKPKILHPSQRVLSASSPASRIKLSEEATPSRASINSNDNTPVVTNTDKLYPLKQRVPQPNYMKMTASSFVKRRLEPNFTNVYTSLDFVQPALGSKAATGGRAGILKKSASAPSSGRTVVTFPSVKDLSSPTASRRKVLSASSHSSNDVTGYGQDSVPNIRNNSTVMPTPRLSAVTTKSR